jgi:hypothetical protein
MPSLDAKLVDGERKGVPVEDFVTLDEDNETRELHRKD